VVTATAIRVRWWRKRALKVPINAYHCKGGCCVNITKMDSAEFDDLFDNPLGAVIANNQINEAAAAASPRYSDDSYENIFEYDEMEEKHDDDDEMHADERPERLRFSNNAANGAAASEDIANYVTAPYDDHDFSQVIEEPTNNPDWCFFCERGQTFKEKEQNKRYDDLHRFINENFNQISIHALTRQVQEMYNKHLRRHCGNVPWHQRVIFEHIVHHAPTVRIMYEMSLRQHNNMLQVLSHNAVYLRNPQNRGEIKLHHDSVRLFLQVSKERDRITRQLVQQRGAASGNSAST
jgi:hypothetical protein